MINGNYRSICPGGVPAPRRKPGIQPGDAVRSRRERPWPSASTGIVVRRRWFGRVDVRWVSGETTTIRKVDLVKLGLEDGDV